LPFTAVVSGLVAIRPGAGADPRGQPPAGVALAPGRRRW